MTEEQYQAIEDCGAAEMQIDETCEIVEISEREFNEDDMAMKRYRKGRLQTKMKIRQAVIRMAKDGVPQMANIYKTFANTPVGDKKKNEPLWDAFKDIPEDF